MPSATQSIKTPKYKMGLGTRAVAEFAPAATALLVSDYFGGFEAVSAASILYSMVRAGIALMVKEDQVNPEGRPLRGLEYAVPAGVLMALGVSFTAIIGDRIKDDVRNPENQALSSAFQSTKMQISNGKESAHDCVPYYAFKPWGQNGEKLGEQCVDLTSPKRRQNYIAADASINGAKPYLITINLPQ